MAPSDEDGSRQEPQADTTNPFIAFRRFADEQMSTLLNSVFGLQNNAPNSSSSYSDRSMKDYQAWLQEVRESRDRLDREAEEMGKIMDVYTKAHNEQQREQDSSFIRCLKVLGEQQEQTSAQDAVERSTDDNEEPLRCPYRPVDREPPLERDDHPTGLFGETAPAHTTFSPPTGFSISLPCDAFSFLGEQFHSHPVTYLLYSPYSPIRLESSQPFRDYDVHWRNAFEDLLAAQSGQDMKAEFTNRRGLSKREWFREMIDLAVTQRERERERGRNVENMRDAQSSVAETVRRKPGFLDRFANAGVDARQSENNVDDDDDDDEDNEDSSENDDDDHDEEVTELDLYDRLLGDSRAASSVYPTIAQSVSRSYAQLQHDSTPPEPDNNKPSILSTLTTTERTTLQDGTVHTKVVLKKKFSDGREESTETMHTQNAIPQQVQGLSQQNMQNGRDKEPGRNSEGAEGKAKRSKGWFWS